MQEDQLGATPEAQMKSALAEPTSDEQKVYDALLREARDGDLPLPELVHTVAAKTKTDPESVTAAIWELVDDNRLSYGADAIPRAPR